MDMQTDRRAARSDGRTGTQLAKGLGWFSLGLGLAELAVPRTLARMIGVEADGRTRGTMRILGARDIANGVGILARPRRPLPVWTRVAGDVVDLALIGWAMRAKRTNGQRLVGALVAVMGVAVIDIYAGNRLEQRAHRARPETTLAAITINRPISEVQARWRELARDLPNIVDVSFRPAPGARGTEVCVETKVPTIVERAIGWLLHDEVDELADGDLRKIKQLMELGEIVHSDASIRRGMHSTRLSARKAAS